VRGFANAQARLRYPRAALNGWGTDAAPVDRKSSRSRRSDAERERDDGAPGRELTEHRSAPETHVEVRNTPRGPHRR
jgi:hypothetical protein